MKKFVYAIIFIIIGFVLNLLLFFFNDFYKEMVINLKHKEEIKINDDYVVNKNEGTEKKLISDFHEEENQQNFDQKTLDEIRMEDIEKQIKETKIKSKINEKKIFDEKWENKEKSIGFTLKQQTNIDFVLWAFKKFNLKKIKSDDELFYLTSEYPKQFLQYNGDHIILYFFSENNYENNLEIFDALTYIASFTINKTNSFGDKSFYINKIKDDGFARIIIKYKNIVFGLQVDKKYFKDIERILKTKII